ncbi:hypothetical protein SESBI_39817 [Sesbania bispinosa]|nr:hypothetical protein SESBI_39817 [Sesbania bispinosa]
MRQGKNLWDNIVGSVCHTFKTNLVPSTPKNPAGYEENNSKGLNATRKPILKRHVSCKAKVNGDS